MQDIHRHPTNNFDYSTLFSNLAEAEKDGIQVVRAFIQIYLDAFPILSSRKNASSNAIYISFGNLDQEELQRLDNYFCIGHFPKGVNKHECFKGWMSEFVKIQNGFRFYLSNAKKLVFICGGIGIGKFDMPEAQTQAGALQQGANFPDRFSYVHKDQLGSLDFDLKDNRKTLQQIRAIRSKQAAEPRDAGVASMLQDSGLNEAPSWLENPALHFDVTQQIPPQTCHSELLGIAGKALTLFLGELTPTGRRRLREAMDEQVRPPHWENVGPLCTDLNGNLRGGAEDIRRNMQLIVLLSLICSPSRPKSRPKNRRR
jgi:hypothetical protein